MAKGKGITNAQAKYLASLQRELGLPYSGYGMTRYEATRAISSALRLLGRLHPASAPTITQVEMIARMNAALGTSYPVPETETDARFLIDGLVGEERRRKRHSSTQRDSVAV